MQQRKATFKLYPSAAQAEGLERLLRAHKDLWNAALEERIDAWRKARRSICYEEQCKALTLVRAELPDDWATMNCSS
jgi:putative transposase